MKLKLFFVLCFAIFAFSNALAQERYVLPVDEGEKDVSFLSFRTKLIQAAKNKDSKYILSIVDPNIRNTFGDDDGIRYFKKVWKIDHPKSEFWEEFLAVITRGGTFHQEADTKSKQFCAPYTFTSFPEDLDAFDYSAIFGKNINLRTKPKPDAPIIANLSHNIVKIDYQNSVENKNKENNYSWLNVETLGGKKGFVKAEYVRSPIDYRACFQKKNGRWKMTVFVAGD